MHATCFTPAALKVPAMSNGTLAAQELAELIAKQQINSKTGIATDQVQPASLDLTLSSEAYRMPGSILALHDESVRSLIDSLSLESVNLSNPTTLARGQVYLVRLREFFDLPDDLEAYTNSKSSTGRIDLATRVIADSSPRYDRLPLGYTGEIWLELIPKSFDVVVQAGVSLNQAIVFRNRNVLDQQQMLETYNSLPLLRDPSGAAIPAERCVFDGRLVMTADLSQDVVGFVAKRSHKALTLNHIGGHEAKDFFSPIPRPDSGYLFLEKDSFYILSTYEHVLVPEQMACEMVPYDTASGEFRAHYAGFFDPGWGIFDGEARGTCAVLEVRPHEDDLILRHGQPICAMAYETLLSPCTKLYGQQGNNYHGQIGPRLSKHFKNA